MLTVKQKLAAIRAKRLGRDNAQLEPSVATTTAPAEGTEPSTPKKKRDRKDEEDKTTPLKKLITPTKGRQRYDPRASRLMWRHTEMQRARKLAARSVMNSDSYSFMTTAIPDEEKLPIPVPDFSNVDSSRDVPCSQESADDSKVDNEEGGDHVDEDEDDAFGEQDEEERALQTAQQADFIGDNCEDSILDVYTSSSLQPPVQEQGSDTELNGSSKEDAAIVKDQTSEIPDPKESSDVADIEEQPSESADPHIPETEETVLHSQEEQTPDDCIAERTAALETHSPHEAAQVDEAEYEAESAGLETMPERNTPEVQDEPVAKALFRHGHETPQLSSSDDEGGPNYGLVDEEAEVDDPDDKLGHGTDANHLTDDEGDVVSGEAEGSDDDDIVPDERQKGKEVVEMAQFHRQWEMDKEQEDIEAVTGADRNILNDADEAAEMLDLGSGEENRAASSDDACNVGTSAECAESGEKADCADATDGNKKSGKADAADKYMEVMFRRDDSRSKVIDDEVQEDQKEMESARRVQQRALWKARQKFKEKIGQNDENSLSHFNLFAENQKNRSHDIRKKLESACRPASREGASLPIKPKVDGKRGKKRSANEPAAEAPEWVKQKTCLERRQRKRQRAVSVGKWSFASHGEQRDKAPTKSSKAAIAGKASLGASCLIRKNRAAGIQAPRMERRRNSEGVSSRSGQARGPTSFKGLLSLLGKQASMDT